VGDGCEGKGIHRIHKQTDEPAIIGTKRKEGMKVHTIAACWRPRGHDVMRGRQRGERRERGEREASVRQVAASRLAKGDLEVAA
jgi:hypothetical protein